MKKIIYTAMLIACFSLIITAQNNTKTIQKANNSLSNGDIQGAISILDKAVNKKNPSFEIFQMRSMLRGMTGNLQGEFDDITKALEFKSKDGELYERRAKTRMFLRHDNSLIVSDLDSAIANGRKVEKVYNLRGTFRHQNRDLEGALSDYQTAFGLNPESVSAVIGIAAIYESKGDKAQAILTLENFLSKYENSLVKMPTVKGKVVAQSDAIILKEENLMVGSNSVIIKTDDGKDSMPSYADLQNQTEQLENTKNLALAYSKLARLYTDQGEYEKAFDAVENAIKVDPTNLRAFGVRGSIKVLTKDYDGAYKDLTKAINASPSFPFNYADRGILLLLMNKDIDAQADFDKYYQIVSYPSARKNLEERIAEAKKTRNVSK